MSASRDARLPHVRACFHVPNNFLTPEYPLRRYTIVTQILPFTYEEGRYATHPNPA